MVTGPGDGSGSGDTGELTLALTDEPAVLGNVAAVSFAFSTSIPATTECRTDSDPYAACTSPDVITLADGMHAFDVRAPVAPQAAEPEHDDVPAPSRLTTLRELSIGSAALGVIGIAGGIRYGLAANDLDRQANAICPATTCSDAHARDLNRSAQHDALASEIMFGAGGEAIAGAVVLWIVGAPVTPVIGDGQAGVAFAGRF